MSKFDSATRGRESQIVDSKKTFWGLVRVIQGCNMIQPWWENKPYPLVSIVNVYQKKCKITIFDGKINNFYGHFQYLCGYVSDYQGKTKDLTFMILGFCVPPQRNAIRVRSRVVGSSPNFRATHILCLMLSRSFTCQISCVATRFCSTILECLISVL